MSKITLMDLIRGYYKVQTFGIRQLADESNNFDGPDHW